VTQKQNITAIIYDKRGRVLSVGQNSYVKTHPLQAKHAIKVGEEHKVYLHAEISAITKCKDLSRAHKLVIVRYDRNGNPALARPCNVCQSAINATNIKFVEHT
jgi:hypothetical protein